MVIVILFIKSNILSLHLFRHLQKAEACIAPYDNACKSKPSFNTIKQYLKPDFCKGTFWNIYFLLENVDKHPYMFLEKKKKRISKLSIRHFSRTSYPYIVGFVGNSGKSYSQRHIAFVLLNLPMNKLK